MLKKVLISIGIALPLCVLQANADNTEAMPKTAVPTSQPSFSLYPPVSTVNLQKRSTISFYLTNDSEKPFTIRVIPMFLAPGASGPFEKDTPLQDNPNAFDISSQVRVSPLVMTLQPNVLRMVRVSVGPEKDLAPGTYMANIRFKVDLPSAAAAPVSSNAESVPAPTVGGDKQSQSVKESSFDIKYIVNQTATIYGNIGTGSAAAAKITCRIVNNQVELTVINDTNYLFAGTLSVVDAKTAKNIIEAKIIPLLPQTKGQRIVDPKQNIAADKVYWQLRGTNEPQVLTCTP